MIKFNNVMNVLTTVGKAIAKYHKPVVKLIGIASAAGAVGYAVSKAADTVHEIDNESLKKGEPLTKGEVAKIVWKKQWPAVAMASTSAVSLGYIDISNSRTIHDMKLTNQSLAKENKGLVEQVAEMATMYNTVNTVKEAMTKKVEEVSGKEVVQQVKNDAVKQAYPVETNSPPIPYVASPKRLQLANDIYAQTGDPDYKVQEYVLQLTGQHFMSYNAYIKEAAETFKKRIEDDYDKGFKDLNDWCDEVGCGLSEIGSAFIWRSHRDYFGISMYEISENGVAKMAIAFDNDPYYDYRREY